jgi:hypothetical protein
VRTDRTKERTKEGMEGQTDVRKESFLTDTSEREIGEGRECDW